MLRTPDKASRTTDAAKGRSSSRAKRAPAASKGHTEHTKAADNTKGLPGQVTRPLKLTMLGAGSGFTPRLVNDVLQIPTADYGEIALVDIDKSRLKTMAQLIQKVIDRLGKQDKWKVVASADRRKVLKGSDYIVNCIEVSGTECVRFDNDIPLKYGLHQCIGDTIGPGGLFKALRTVPVWLDVLRDAEELCPNALVLNYTNPMSMMMLAAGRASSMQAVGLCHSVQGTSHLLAKRAGVPYPELEWECAGVNHLAWFTKLNHKGKSVYPILMKKAEQDIAGKPSDPNDAGDLVRKDMMLHFGAFITESSGHLSEYLPYYRKRPDLMERYCRPGYDGESGFYAANWPKWRSGADEQRLRMVRGEESIEWERSWEYAAFIIEAREKDTPYRIHGNVMNRFRGGGLCIDNLPHDGVVEVACMVDKNGINPTVYGRLPPQMAGVCDWQMRMYDLAVTAAVERSKEAAIYALMLDPYTAAVCSPAEIKEMTLKLFAAEKRFLPGYK
jgi:alpha-galactosidase